MSLVKIILVVGFIILLLIAMNIYNSNIVGGDDDGNDDIKLLIVEPLYIDWPTFCYPARVVNECINVINKDLGNTNNYGPKTIELYNEYKLMAQALNNKYNIGTDNQINPDDLILIRQMLIPLMSRRLGIQALKVDEKIREKYDLLNGTILDIAKSLKLPPTVVLYQYMSTSYDRQTLLTNIKKYPSLVPARIMKQIPEIFNNDITSPTYKEIIRMESQQYEEKLGNYLLSLGISFLTESELRKRGSRYTPDFKMTRPLFINGKEVNWIDAKNYPMFGAYLTLKDIADQAIKYTAEFGPGAMIFNGGIRCNIANMFTKDPNQAAAINNTLLLKWVPTPE